MRAALKTRILVSFFGVILILGLPVALLGRYVIERDIIEKVQNEVRRDLAATRYFYNQEIARIGERMRLSQYDGDLERLRERLDLDYLVVVSGPQVAASRSHIVRTALARGEGLGGTRIIKHDELARMGNHVLIERATIQIKATPRAIPTDRTVLEDAMVKEYALPLRDASGAITAVAYGGRIVNRDYAFVDRIRQLVFGNENYDGRWVGTVTIFLGDTRIATNVLDETGRRAIGTRVSEQVYRTVIEQGQTFDDRAFVVSEWYKTAYEPITNIDGEIIGILYVGILEKPYLDLARNIMLMFLAILAGATVLAVVLAVVLAGAISSPLTHVLRATKKLSDGDLAHRVPVDEGAVEFNELACSFNDMSHKLQEREQSLNAANEKLAALNKSYLDLIGFVAHELKGILASTILNAYSVRDGFLGMINFKQRRAMDSVTRNLDYLSATVRKFLNLSRIEKGELDFHPKEVHLRHDVLDVSIESFSRMAGEKKMTIRNDVDSALTITGDVDLLQIACNNLVGNAVKYGTDAGNVIITGREEGSKVRIEVYNDSRPITQEQIGKLFKKFSRLDTPEGKKVKGTGLGLYITKEIIERHGGRIWVEPRDTGNSFIFEIERCNQC